MKIAASLAVDEQTETIEYVLINEQLIKLGKV